MLSFASLGPSPHLADISSLSVGDKTVSVALLVVAREEIYTNRMETTRRGVDAMTVHESDSMLR